MKLMNELNAQHQQAQEENNAEPEAEPEAQPVARNRRGQRRLKNKIKHQEEHEGAALGNNYLTDQLGFGKKRGRKKKC
jgi:hypothetical protein